MKDIPNYSSRWAIKKLGDVAELNPKTSKDILSDDLEVDFIPMRLVEEKTGGIAEPEKRRFHSVKQGYVSFANNDILFAKVTPCMENGKIAIVNNLNNNIGFGSSEFHVIRVSEQILNSFLFYFLIRDKFRSEAAANMTGAVGLRRVPKQFLENYILPLPTIQEQKAIVTRIEELFSELDAGRRLLGTIKAQIETYRKAILRVAFNDPKIDPKVEVETQQLNAVARLVSGQTPKGINSIISDGEFPFYKISDMNYPENEIEMIHAIINLTGKELRNMKLKLHPKGTIIFPKRGGAILTNKKRILTKESSFDLNIMGAIPTNKVISKYLYYWFMQLDLKKICDGSNVPQINYTNIAGLDIPIYPIKYQKLIVNTIETRLSIANELDELLEITIKKVELLKHTILNKAFDGKLVKTPTT